MIKEVPRYFSDEESDDVGKHISLKEVENTVGMMPRDKSPGPDGWKQELFQHFFDIMGNDLLFVVEESRQTGRVYGSLNATFVALIPKECKPASFNDFKPIALCNFVYKIITKMIASRIKSCLYFGISKEQFDFIEGRQIIDAKGVVQEALHNIKVKNIKFLVLKLDLIKAYDRVD